MKAPACLTRCLSFSAHPKVVAKYGGYYNPRSRPVFGRSLIRDRAESERREYSTSGEAAPLFNVLFPTNAAPSAQRSSAGRGQVEREPEQSSDSVSTQAPLKHLEKLQGREHRADRVDEPTLLMVTGLDRNLSESDFRRIAPKGKHIKEWSGPGHFLKVFPERDPHSLAPRSRYYILFSSLSNALVFQSHVLQMRSKEIKPASNFTASRSGGDETIAEYLTIASPGQRPEFNVLPNSTRLRDVINHRGYERITSVATEQFQGGHSAARQRAGSNVNRCRTYIRERHDRTWRAVLFSINAAPARGMEEIVQRVIDTDGQKRGVPWQCTLEPLTPNFGNARSREKGDAPAVDLNDATEKRTTVLAHRWILTFEDENEAQRFVSRWHQMDFLRDSKPDEEDHKNLKLTRINAEILW